MSRLLLVLVNLPWVFANDVKVGHVESEQNPSGNFTVDVTLASTMAGIDIFESTDAISETSNYPETTGVFAEATPETELTPGVGEILGDLVPTAGKPGNAFARKYGYATTSYEVSDAFGEVSEEPRRLGNLVSGREDTSDPTGNSASENPGKQRENSATEKPNGFSAKAESAGNNRSDTGSADRENELDEIRLAETFDYYGLLEDSPESEKADSRGKLERVLDYYDLSEPIGLVNETAPAKPLSGFANASANPADLAFNELFDEEKPADPEINEFELEFSKEGIARIFEYYDLLSGREEKETNDTKSDDASMSREIQALFNSSEEKATSGGFIFKGILKGILKLHDLENGDSYEAANDSLEGFPSGAEPEVDEPPKVLLDAEYRLPMNVYDLSPHCRYPNRKRDVICDWPETRKNYTAEDSIEFVAESDDESSRSASGDVGAGLKNSTFAKSGDSDLDVSRQAESRDIENRRIDFNWLHRRAARNR